MIWKTEDIAAVCHEANRAYCERMGDLSQPPWNEAPQWQIDSAIEGVRYHLARPHALASSSHDNWLRQKEADGWVYGPIKDSAKKEHPCMVPFEELPEEQQLKDHLFKAIVDALRPLI